MQKAKLKTTLFDAANYLESAKGNPQFATILKVMRALDLKITARAG